MAHCRRTTQRTRNWQRTCRPNRCRSTFCYLTRRFVKLASQFDIVAKIYSCPAGYKLEGTEKKDGVEYKVCISVEQYMWVSRSRTYDIATKTCTCSDDPILDNNTKMGTFNQEKANQQKCKASGVEWNLENGSGYCKTEETNNHPIVVDKNNLNFIHVAYMLKGKEDDEYLTCWRI